VPRARVLTLTISSEPSGMANDECKPIWSNAGGQFDNHKVPHGMTGTICGGD